MTIEELQDFTIKLGDRLGALEDAIRAKHVKHALVVIEQIKRVMEDTYEREWLKWKAKEKQ